MEEAIYISVPPAEMEACFASILLKLGFTAKDAHQCASIFTDNSLDGIYTHGVNRFPRFVQYVQKGYVRPGAAPSLAHRFGAIEQWNGNLAPGPLNAMHATERAVSLASENGIGCVTMANTNHWMRGGTYGWQAAKAGCIFIGWTNTTAIMPAWGAIDAKLGNNPLVLAIPHEGQAIVLDMAMSQFSYGAMEMAVLKNENLRVQGGYNKDGELTNDPAEILASKRPLPIGFWKGAGLALLLDLLATVLSGGFPVNEISKKEAEYGLSQVFIAVDPSRLGNHSTIAMAVSAVIEDYKLSAAEDDSKKITYPGERVMQTRQKNIAHGIPVLKSVWDTILEFR